MACMLGANKCMYQFHPPPSSYPDKRVKKDDQGREMGVVGSVSLLQNVTVASQPVAHMDWNPDKVRMD